MGLHLFFPAPIPGYGDRDLFELFESETRLQQRHSQGRGLLMRLGHACISPRAHKG